MQNVGSNLKLLTNNLLGSFILECRLYKNSVQLAKAKANQQDNGEHTLLQ